jgi:hypothetical protein
VIRSSRCRAFRSTNARPRTPVRRRGSSLDFCPWTALPGDHTVAEPADLDSLLRKLQDTGAPIGVYTSCTGSAECLVGFIDAVGPDHLVPAEINSNGTATREKLEFLLSAIIAIDWGNDYLAALAELARSSTEGEF